MHERIWLGCKLEQTNPAPPGMAETCWNYKISRIVPVIRSFTKVLFLRISLKHVLYVSLCQPMSVSPRKLCNTAGDSIEAAGAILRCHCDTHRTAKFTPQRGSQQDENCPGRKRLCKHLWQSETWAFNEKLTEWSIAKLHSVFANFANAQVLSIESLGLNLSITRLQYCSIQPNGYDVTVETSKYGVNIPTASLSSPSCNSWWPNVWILSGHSDCVAGRCHEVWNHFGITEICSQKWAVVNYVLHCQEETILQILIHWVTISLLTDQQHLPRKPYFIH